MGREKGGLMDVDQEDLMILLPSLFSSKDMPDNIVLKSCTSVGSKKKTRGTIQLGEGDGAQSCN